MKISRTIWFACWILSLVAISFYGGAISYGFFTTITLIPIVSIIYLACVYYNFKIYQHLDTKTAACYQTIPFYFTLQNETIFTFASIRVMYYSNFSSISELDDNDCYELLPNTGITKNTTLSCKYRGEYQVGINTVEIQDMFRLFKFRYKNPYVIEVDVKPAVIYLDNLKSIDEKTLIENISNYNVTEQDVIVRPYEIGDDVRHVNWKVSARERELMVRKQIGTSKEGIAVILSTQRKSDNKEEYLPIESKMLELSIALTLYFGAQNTPVNSYYTKNEIQHKCVDSLDKFEPYYNDVATVAFKETSTDEEYFAKLISMEQLYENKVAFFVVSEWNDAVEVAADALTKNGLSVVTYIVTKDKYAIGNIDNIVASRIIAVSPEDDLKEVL